MAKFQWTDEILVLAEKSDDVQVVELDIDTVRGGHWEESIEFALDYAQGAVFTDEVEEAIVIIRVRR